MESPLTQEMITVAQLADLKSLEKQAFRKFYEDGLLDVLFGLMMVGMSVGAVVEDWLDNEAMGLLFMLGIAVVLVTSLKIVRVQLLRSRLGHFTPGPGRRRKITSTRLILLASAVLGVIAFGVGAVANGGGISATAVEVWLPLVWFVNATVVLGAMAYLLDVPRFYLYGVLFGLVGPLLIWPDVLWDSRVPPLVAFGAPAVPIIIIGLWKLTHFLKDYPAQPTSRQETVLGGS